MREIFLVLQSKLSDRWLRRGLVLCLLGLTACGKVWNDPYPQQEQGRNILYSAFTERPKHLDPVQSYAEDEIMYTAQIYEPPLQYHYLKRPYEVVPTTLTALPTLRLLDANKQPLPEGLASGADASKVAYSEYTLHLKRGIRYQPHPAFAKDASGQYVYHALTLAQLKDKRALSDFTQTDTRELKAEDYAYEIKRLAHPHLHSPILGIMGETIVGLKELAEQLKKDAKGQDKSTWLDLRAYNLPGVQVVDDYTLRITLRNKYPQFQYWLTMPFFAPMPWEADKFHSQAGMAERNLTLDWYPIGTGPYMLTENNPNARMVLTRNPNYHGDTYPCEGEAADRAAGLLADCGKALPFIDQAIFTREKEQIPYWNKFLQGYYDASGISSDSFDQAVQFGSGGEVMLTDEMRAQGIRLSTSVATSTFYMGFNWLDPVVGGGEPTTAIANRKLRQAISVAIDQEEFISIFQNGRGVAAQSAIPPGIFGYLPTQAGMNPVVYDWVDGKPQRKPIEEAKRLLAEAGWPDGRNAKTGEPLVLYLDTTDGGLGSKSRIDWYTRQFQKMGAQLVVRSTDFNRFQDKIRKGAVQLFFFGWNADYPDPENFYFLLDGQQTRVKHGGENSANYSNPEFDRLFAQMKAMENGPARQDIINRMNAILWQDAPWMWGFHPKSYVLQHAWLFNRKPSNVGNNGLKYQRLDVALREQQRARWNKPVVWPLVAGALLLIALVWPAIRHWRRSEQARGATSN